jgi:excinuclease ABC subunit A
MSRVPCSTCKGARLKPEILAVTIKDANGRELNIHKFSELTIEVAAAYIAGLTLTGQQRHIVTEVLREIESRLQFLLEVGLGYLTLNRESGTLSGGEAQRIRLATRSGAGWRAFSTCSMSPASDFISATTRACSARSAGSEISGIPSS